VSVLKSIINILQYYDEDNNIPLYGFGAKIPPDLRINSNCFALNGNIFRPETCSLDDLVMTYKRSLKKVKMNGPCMLSEVIHQSLDYCKFNPVSQDNQ